MPVIPILAIATISGASYLLAWYNGLSKSKQEEADAEAIKIAKQLFGISKVSELDKRQTAEVKKALEKRRAIPSASDD